MNKSMILIAVSVAFTSAAAQASLAQASPARHFSSPPSSTQAQASPDAGPLLIADRGISRSTTVTNRAGKTAERRVSGSVDAETRTRTRAVEGTTFRGKTYSGTSTTQRTEDGYIRSSNQVGPNGGTRSREAEAVIDRDTGTITKDVSVTGPDGETRTRTVVRSVEHGEDAQ